MSQYVDFFFHQCLSNMPFDITFTAVPSQDEKNMYNNLLLISDLKWLDIYLIC